MAEVNDIKLELLIDLVRDRPTIWDKSLESYKDKHLKESAWREICMELNEGFQSLDQLKRQQYCKQIIKKWTQTRDSWMKSMKKHKEQMTTGSASKPSRLYLYHEQMNFLKKIISVSTETHESTDHNNEESSEVTQGPENEEPRETDQAYTTTKTVSSGGISKKRRTMLNYEVDNKMIQFMEHQMNASAKGTVNIQNDRHLSFFNSILPSLSSFTDDQTLEFQSSVISLIQTIKRNARSQSNFYPPTTSTLPQPLQQTIPSTQQNMNYYNWQNAGYFIQPSTPRFTAVADSEKSPLAPSPMSSTSQDTNYTDIDLSSL